jgi:hypothetical protein
MSIDTEKRIAILLRGVSYNRKHRTRGSSPGNYFVDFNKTKDNIKTNIIEPLKNCEVFITTYLSEKEGELLDFYKPQSYCLIDYRNSNQKETFIAGLELIWERHQEKPFDFVIISRFDVDYLKPITEMNIDMEKMNFIWREYEHYWRVQHRVGDCFHALASKYLRDFTDTLNNFNEDGMFHTFYDPLKDKIGEENITFIEEGFYDSNSHIMKNPIYEIIRLRSIPG